MNKQDGRRRLERVLASARGQPLPPVPVRGWIRAIRDALGMSSTELAARIGQDQSRVPRTEQAEVAGTVTLATMERYADALGCTFTYALVPRRPLDDAVMDQARRKAALELSAVGHSMTLEDQSPPPDPDLLDELAAHWVDRRGLWS